MGRPRKSLADHRLDGTRPSYPVGVARADGGLADVAPPAELDDIGARVWLQVTASLPDTVDSLDECALRGLCEWYSLWHRTMQKAKEVDVAHAYRFAIQGGVCWKHFAALANELGLTPSSRRKLDLVWQPSPPSDDDRDSEAVDLLSGLEV